MQEEAGIFNAKEQNQYKLNLRFENFNFQYEAHYKKGNQFKIELLQNNLVLSDQHDLLIK
jgi:hypothetical protein